MNETFNIPRRKNARQNVERGKFFQFFYILKLSQRNFGMKYQLLKAPTPRCKKKRSPHHDQKNHHKPRGMCVAVKEICTNVYEFCRIFLLFSEIQFLTVLRTIFFSWGWRGTRWNVSVIRNTKACLPKEFSNVEVAKACRGKFFRVTIFLWKPFVEPCLI